MNKFPLSISHLIIIHMYRFVRKNISKLPYGALITQIFKHKGVDFFEHANNPLVNVEIGKETLKKMIMKMTPEGWVNTRNGVLPIGQRADEKTKDVLKENQGCVKGMLSKASHNH